MAPCHIVHIDMDQRSDEHADQRSDKHADEDCTNSPDKNTFDPATRTDLEEKERLRMLRPPAVTDDCDTMLQTK